MFLWQSNYPELKSVLLFCLYKWPLNRGLRIISGKTAASASLMIALTVSKKKSPKFGAGWKRLNYNISSLCLYITSNVTHETRKNRKKNVLIATKKELSNLFEMIFSAIFHSHCVVHFPSVAQKIVATNRHSAC